MTTPHARLSDPLSSERAVVAISKDMTVQDLVDERVYEFQQTEFPVCDDGNLIGSVGVRQIKEVPRSDWPNTRVGDIMVPAEEAQTISPDDDALDAVRRLQTEDIQALIVAKDRKPLGVLSRADVMKLLNLKMDLEAA